MILMLIAKTPTNKNNNRIITALEEPKFGEWDANGFAPEAEVLAALKAVPGISQVETQTFTLEEM